MCEDPPPRCGNCPAIKQVNWSPVFAMWLCPECRWSKTERLLMPARRLSPGEPQ